MKFLSVKFWLTEVLVPGAITARHPSALKPKHLLPAQETTLTSTNKLIFDEKKIRFENNHPTWLVPAGKFVPRSFVCTFNGELVRHFFPKSVSGDGRIMSGVISRGTTLDAVMNGPILLPITICFRGLANGATTYQIVEWKPTGASLPIDGVMCRVYVLKSRSTTKHFWLDPSRGYVVCRSTNWRNGQLAAQCDVIYRGNEVGGWAPELWALKEFDAGGAVTITTKVEVLELKINVPQPKETFDIVFPPGCYVNDNRARKDYQVQDDGSMREVVPLGTEPGPVFVQPWYRRHHSSCWSVWGSSWLSRPLRYSPGCDGVLLQGRDRSSIASL